ncbi:Zeta-carotene desaturase, chloroplastic/chromoplastic [Capsicum baccatum]|uniref:Zeta-carotene desaturase, chloroplastic/chromoplastic n=1 Tax=Capsicum baccatum TaxID=33114 RepID=A0A2G2W7B8_CAPBA|nr:Zeta-carotene desaturase, chloroplastic/chromoplastic [Capsicum baccatum]
MATSSAYLCCPVTSATGKKRVFPNGSTGFLVFGGRRLSNRLVTPKSVIRADLDSMVSDMSTNAPKGLFPPEPEHYRGPKLKVAIIGAGLAGMSTAVELLDQGHEIYDKARNAVALALIPVVRALVDPDGGALQQIRDLDSVSFSDWFMSKGGMRVSIQRMWDPVAYALGFIDCDNISARSSAFSESILCSQVPSKVGMQRACDVPGIKRLVPQKWRELVFFDNIYKLVGVPVVTVQLRYNGWVSELQDLERSRCVLAPGDPYMPLPNEEIIRRVSKQVLALFPSSQGFEITWSSVVKIGQSLYREGPGKDPFRPDQKTPVENFFLAGSYTKQDYIDSMEGATLSGRQASAYICDAGEQLLALRKKIAAAELNEICKGVSLSDELSLIQI